MKGMTALAMMTALSTGLNYSPSSHHGSKGGDNSTPSSLNEQQKKTRKKKNKQRKNAKRKNRK
jgi:hypothetical protein